MLATKLVKRKIKYTLFNDGKIGQKILASGNGKCNIANKNYSDKYYHNNELAKEVLKNQKELFEYFENLDIYTKEDKEGRMYPISESSLSVLSVLLNNIKQEIISIKIESIEKRDKQFYLNQDYGPFDFVVLALGSIANYNKTYSFSIIEDLNIKMTPFQPSLVGFKTNLNFHEISGVRAKVSASLYQENELIHEESGEVIFKDNGISGICIMNLSSYYNHLINKKNCKILLKFTDKKYDNYTTILHPKLLNYIEEHKVSIDSFLIPIKDTYGFENAQVCSGGISIDELTKSLRLKKDPNIFVGGELIDVDGVCGGYNLMFAFCCSLVIAKELENEISNRKF